MRHGTQRKEVMKMDERIIEEQRRTNELLEKLINQNKEENELLTIEQVHEEYEIGINMVRKMFNDPELAVQKYTVPFKVSRKSIQNYLQVRHDYLCER